MGEFPQLDELVKKCDYDTRLAITAWVFKHIVNHAKEGGSYRYLIYDRLGFDHDAYVPLYEAGGLEISNEFDIDKMDRIKDIVREHKIDVLKEIVGMCDEHECYKEASCGTPTNEKYRWTCYEHRPEKE